MRAAGTLLGCAVAAAARVKTTRHYPLSGEEEDVEPLKKAMVARGFDISADMAACGPEDHHFHHPIKAPDGKNHTMQYHATSELTKGGNYKAAIIVQHGAGRDSDAYYCTMVEMMHKKQKYRDPTEVIIVTPRFIYFKDPEGRLDTDLYWNTSKPFGDWRGGAYSSAKPPRWSHHNGTGPDGAVSAFDVMDQLVLTLDNNDLFPQLDEIAFVGHSAGGQFVLRYAWMTHLKPQIDLDPKTDLRYVVMNPSSYLYPNEERWQMTCGKCNCDSAECICDKMCGHDGGLYVPPKKKMEEHYPCDDPHYNDWPYGLAGWMPDYVKQVKLDQAIRRFPKRDLRLLVGERDMCNENLPGCNDLCWTKHNETGLGFCYRNHMDTRCPAMMQGQFRRIRGLRYTEYMMRFYMKTTHPLFIVPGVGHDANGMFASEKGIQTIFEHTKGCFESDSKEEEEEAGAEEGPAKARALAAAQTSGGWAPGVAIAAAAFAAGVIATITLKGGKRDDELPSAASYGATDDGVRM